MPNLIAWVFHIRLSVTLFLNRRWLICGRGPHPSTSRLSIVCNMRTSTSGRNAHSAIIRYLQGESLTGHEEIVREYAYSALVCAEAAQRAIEKMSVSRVFMSHGTYADWGPALKVAVARKLPVIAWMASYLTARFYFRSVDDAARIDFHNLSQPGWENRKRIPLTAGSEGSPRQVFAQPVQGAYQFRYEAPETISWSDCSFERSMLRRLTSPSGESTPISTGTPSATTRRWLMSRSTPGCWTRFVRS